MILAAALLAAGQPAPAETAPPPPPAVHAEMTTGSISNMDYPSAATRAREEGVTIISFAVGPDGRASDCRLHESSGSARLDGQACGLITRRFRYSAARDAAGQAVTDWLVMRFEWQLPRTILLSRACPLYADPPCALTGMATVSDRRP